MGANSPARCLRTTRWRSCRHRAGEQGADRTRSANGPTLLVALRSACPTQHNAVAVGWVERCETHGVLILPPRRLVVGRVGGPGGPAPRGQKIKSGPLNQHKQARAPPGFPQQIPRKTRPRAPLHGGRQPAGPSEEGETEDGERAGWVVGGGGGARKSNGCVFALRRALSWESGTPRREAGLAGKGATRRSHAGVSPPLSLAVDTPRAPF